MSDAQVPTPHQRDEAGEEPVPETAPLVDPVAAESTPEHAAAREAEPVEQQVADDGALPGERAGGVPMPAEPEASPAQASQVVTSEPVATETESAPVVELPPAEQEPTAQGEAPPAEEPAAADEPAAAVGAPPEEEPPVDAPAPSEQPTTDVSAPSEEEPPPPEDEPPAAAEDEPPAKRALSPWIAAGSMLILVAAIVMAVVVGQATQPSPPPKAKGEPPPAGANDFVAFRDLEAGFSIEYPKAWERKMPQEPDPTLRLVAQSPGKEGLLVIAQSPPADLNQYLNQFEAVDLQGMDVGTRRQGVNVNGMLGVYYVYTFKARSGEDIGHLHYFLPSQQKLNILVLEARPAQDAQAEVGNFQHVLNSFRTIGQTPGTTDPPPPTPPPAR